MDPNQSLREAELSRRRVLQLGAAGALALPTLSGLLVVCGDDGGSGTSEPSPTGGGTAPATTVARDLADQTAILEVRPDARRVLRPHPFGRRRVRAAQLHFRHVALPVADPTRRFNRGW